MIVSEITHLSVCCGYSDLHLQWCGATDFIPVTSVSIYNIRSITLTSTWNKSPAILITCVSHNPTSETGEFLTFLLALPWPVRMIAHVFFVRVWHYKWIPFFLSLRFFLHLGFIIWPFMSHCLSKNIIDWYELLEIRMSTDMKRSQNNIMLLEHRTLSCPIGSCQSRRLLGY